MFKIRVIVIDDDVYTVRAICKKLKEIGINTDGFTDPIEALEAIEKNKYPIIITDNSMPIIDGVELAERVLKVYNPIIVLISVICGQVSKLNLDHVFDYMIQKPLDYDDFTEKIVEIVNRKEKSEMLKAVEVKDRVFLEEIAHILSDNDFDYDSSLYNKISDKMHVDKSTIRKRFNKISHYLHKESKELVRKLVNLNDERENQKEDAAENL